MGFVVGFQTTPPPAAELGPHRLTRPGPQAEGLPHLVIHVSRVASLPAPLRLRWPFSLPSQHTCVLRTF